MTEYYLEVKYQGVVVYRKESLKPLVMNEVELSVGTVQNRKDVPLFTKRMR